MRPRVGKSVLVGLFAAVMVVSTTAPVGASRGDRSATVGLAGARVRAQAADTPPTVSLTSPSPGSTASHVVGLAATASDDVGVQAVEFFLDGSTSLGVDTTAPYVGEWNSTTAGNGAHTLTARARDTAGNQTTSSGVSVTTANPAFVNETVVPGITDA